MATGRNEQGFDAELIQEQNAGVNAISQSPDRSIAK